MNTLLKSAVAGALALGATSAFAIGVPSSNNSDVILYVDALTSTGASAGVYALDTGITLSSLMPGPYSSTAANSTAFSAPNKVVGPSATLSTFLSSHSGNTIQWTLEGGQYNNPGFAGGSPTSSSNNNSVAPGSALAVFTSPALTTAFPGVSTASTGALENFLNGLQNDYQNGLSSLTGTETGTATETGVSSQSKYGFFGGPDLAATGSTAIKLFGFTGNNVNGGQLQSYLLGTATLGTDGTLTLNGNTTTAPVPLPAAVWLFGSGLMGLVGVSRRRKAAAVV
jgi:hypothetical protein